MNLSLHYPGHILVIFLCSCVKSRDCVNHKTFRCNSLFALLFLVLKEKISYSVGGDGSFDTNQIFLGHALFFTFSLSPPSEIIEMFSTVST